MAKFKNLKKAVDRPIMDTQPEYKVVRPLAGPTKVLKRTEPLAKKSVPDVKSNSSSANKPGIKPKKIGTFMTILFVTIFLQVVLLVSLLYLSPQLIH